MGKRSSKKRAFATAEESIQPQVFDLIDLLTAPDRPGTFDVQLHMPTWTELAAVAQRQTEQHVAPSAGLLSKDGDVPECRPRPIDRRPTLGHTIEQALRQVVASPSPIFHPPLACDAPHSSSAAVVRDSQDEPAAREENDRIRDDALACRACDLYSTRTNLVCGVGPLHAKLVFVGEAPGADEDAAGVPFVGRAGQHLNKILAAAGFKREEVYICNILLCRPPENRAPTLSEMLACAPLLKRQLEIIRPALLACLGNTAISYLIGPDTPGITKIHGQWFPSIFGIPAMALYHPAYLLRNASRAKGSPNWQMWQDIQALKQRYNEIRASGRL